MIRYDMPQGSPEWLEARLGIPTASQFHKLISQKTLKPSASASKYLYQLVAETMIGEPVGGLPEEGMILRGAEMEDEALAWYELQRDVTCEKVGFCMDDDGRYGCSPDRLVGEDGGLEIKCPSAQVFVGYLLGEGTHEYRCQVQGNLYVTGRKWWDLLIYHPLMESVLLRFEPDPEWLAAFEPALEEFLERLERSKEAVKGRLR